MTVLQAIGKTIFGCIYIVDLETQKIEFISEKPFLFSGLKSSEVEKLGYKFFRKYAKKEDIAILKEKKKILDLKEKEFLKKEKEQENE